MKINPDEITKEMIEKAKQCETAEELMELAKSEGFDITRVEAEAYLEELSSEELEAEDLDDIAGGKRRKGDCNERRRSPGLY